MGKIYVVCPVSIVTGGAELLHQFVDELRRLGRDAYISYWPFGGGHERTAAYLNYDAPVHELVDIVGNTVVVPEALTRSTKSIINASCVIWWLSVDNYFCFPQDYVMRSPFVYKTNRLYNPIRRLRTLLTTRRPLFALRGMRHFAQSYYARDFLCQAGIHSDLLTDYLSREHLEGNSPGRSRQNVIAYNPKKGAEVTKQLMAVCPEFKFQPIQNMTSVQVANFLRSCKVYIDFGNHPGKDRPPREAVMAGCCVITGRSGAAAYFEDTPVPDRYRLDPRSPGFEQNFRKVMSDVFDRYEDYVVDFDDWREHIRSEHANFRAQVAQYFGG